MAKTLGELQSFVMEQARRKGFGTSPAEVNVGEKIALIHSEISEAYAAYRRNVFDGKDGFKEELGDAIQRLLHLCGIFGIDVEEEILKKLVVNRDREWDWDELNETHTRTEK